MDSAAHLLSFSMATQTQNFGTVATVMTVQKQHSCGVLADRWKSDSSTVLKLGFNFGINENFNF
jgi:hypothetical protein